MTILFHQVYGVRANASFTVEVKARLWNSTLVEDYTSVDRVEVVSKASVIVDPVYTQEVRDLIQLMFPEVRDLTQLMFPGIHHRLTK